MQRTSRCDTRLRTTPEALLQLVRDRWSIEGWHWIRDTQLHEDAHRYRGNGAGAMATLRTAALTLLRLSGWPSIGGPWAELAPAFWEEANRRLRANGLPTSLGKELWVLCWAVEEASIDDIPNALCNWEDLAPEERWWLYTMTVATTGQALRKGVGWRKALRAALADNPFGHVAQGKARAAGACAAGFVAVSAFPAVVATMGHYPIRGLPWTPHVCFNQAAARRCGYRRSIASAAARWW
jgi:hypothetical protein